MYANVCILKMAGVYYEQHEALLWGRLLHKAVGERSEWEYPFAVAGINVTFMLEEVLEMRDPRTRAPLLDRLPVGAAGRGFVGLLKESDTVFEEVRRVFLTAEMCFAVAHWLSLWKGHLSTHLGDACSLHGRKFHTLRAGKVQVMPRPEEAYLVRLDFLVYLIIPSM